LSEATSILAGDRPYRDFFESGMPLAAYMSAGVQLLSGRRLIGEFLLQWTLIIAGVALAFDLGLRVSRSSGALLAVVPLVLLILANTPTYHYQKLFFFPLTIWVAWRYIEQPTARRAAALGFVSAAAFLSRHDFGIYCGCASVVALLLPRLTDAASRHVGSMAMDVGAYAIAVVVAVMPWAVVVQMNEGLVDYTRVRTSLYQPPGESRYASLLKLNPIRALTREPLPGPTTGVVGFFWKDDVDAATRHRVEQQFGLRALDKRDPAGRVQYAVSNVYDLELFELDPYINDGAGFQWERLSEFRSYLPGRRNVLLWLQQITLLVPFLLLMSAAWQMWRGWRRSGTIPLDASRLVLAGSFLAVVDAALLKEPSYVVIVTPVSAALSARFLLGPSVVLRALAVGVLLVTTVTATVYARETPLLKPAEYRYSLSGAFERLLAAQPAGGDTVFHYLHECTVEGDRLLVTGSTPFDVSYYAQRPIAGGHLAWDHGWRSDPAHEQQSLALLQKQSVPFAVSTGNPVMSEFEQYPRIYEYLKAHYVEVEGSHGTLLVDARRRPSGRFGPMGFPCFR
jgi:hypothetical protein